MFKLIQKGTVAVVLSVLLSGCATKALWSEGSVSLHEPYPPSRLALFDVPAKRDVLAFYDEMSPGSDKPRRRAYWLVENNNRVKSVQKPKFVSLSATNGATLIPLYEQCADVPAGIEVYARTNSTGNRVTIFRNDERWQDAFDLPSYRCWVTSAKRAALTPLTVVLDITIVGGYWCAKGFAESNSHITIPK